MSTIDERIAKKFAELDQLKQQRKDKHARDLVRQRKLEERRKFIIGDTILKTFPNLLPMTTEQTTGEKNALISNFEYFIDFVAIDRELIHRLEAHLRDAE